MGRSKFRAVFGRGKVKTAPSYDLWIANDDGRYNSDDGGLKNWRGLSVPLQRKYTWIQMNYGWLDEFLISSLPKADMDALLCCIFALPHTESLRWIGGRRPPLSFVLVDMETRERADAGRIVESDKKLFVVWDDAPDNKVPVPDMKPKPACEGRKNCYAITDLRQAPLSVWYCNNIWLIADEFGALATVRTIQIPLSDNSQHFARLIQVEDGQDNRRDIVPAIVAVLAVDSDGPIRKHLASAQPYSSDQEKTESEGPKLE
ncbi:hypothetical protein C8R47DRAFT_1202233 [Mycena vitilis]|nr:hypothetical protein C8R47DRAFT_1202233 [Mycena vitilis]